MRILLIFLFSFQILHSQEFQISGKIFDKTENKPVTGASIYIPEQQKANISDENGNFTLKNLKAGNYKLKISCIGYAGSETEIKIPSSTENTYFLEQAVEDLEMVVITGTRSEKPLKEVPVLTQVIHPEKLKASGITSVGAALQHEIPGVEFSQFNFRPKVSFQGMNARYILFLIDGERISGEMEGDIDYNRLNLDNVDRIEVVRGASSALYGSNAIGGVINIITKKSQLPFDANLFSRVSDYDALTAGSTIGFRRGKLASRSSFNYNQSSRFDINPDPGITTQEKFKNVTFNQRFDLNINKKISLIANGGLYYSRVYDASIIPLDHAYSGLNGYFKAIYTPVDSLQFELSYAADNYINYNVQVRKNDIHAKTAYDWQQTARLLARYHTQLGTFIAGTEYKPEKIYSERIIDSIRTANEAIVFLQHDFSFWNHYSIVTGVRNTSHSIYGNNFVPKISLMAKFDPFIFRASYGMGFRSPTLKEMYYFFDHFGMFTLYGNENLKPEKSNYLGFSVEHNRPKSSVSLNLYYNKVKDLIANNQFEPKVFQYVNIASARVLGLDFISRFMINSKWNFGTGLSLNDSRNIETDKRVYGISPISVNGNINYAFKLFKQKTNLEIFGRYTGKREYEPVGEITYLDNAYQSWRLSLTQYYKTYFIFTMGIDNIFNQIDPLSLGNTSPGRRFFASVNFNLTKY